MCCVITDCLQELVYCGSEAGKLPALRSLVQGGLVPPVLIFTQTKERASQLFKELLYDGIHVDVIHSERSQQQRENTIRAFRAGGVGSQLHRCKLLIFFPGVGVDLHGAAGPRD